MKKYTHELTAGLTPDNWKDKIDLPSMNLNDLVDIWGDMKAMEAFGKKLGGFLKEVIRSRMPEGEDEYESAHFHVQRNFRERAGGLDRERIQEELGEDWVFDHCKDPTEYVEMRVTRLEE